MTGCSEALRGESLLTSEVGDVYSNRLHVLAKSRQAIRSAFLPLGAGTAPIVAKAVASVLPFLASCSHVVQSSVWSATYAVWANLPFPPASLRHSMALTILRVNLDSGSGNSTGIRSRRPCRTDNGRPVSSNLIMRISRAVYAPSMSRSRSFRRKRWGELSSSLHGQRICSRSFGGPSLPANTGESHFARSISAPRCSLSPPVAWRSCQKEHSTSLLSLDGSRIYRQFNVLPDFELVRRSKAMSRWVNRSWPTGGGTQ